MVIELFKNFHSYQSKSIDQNPNSYTELKSQLC